MREKRLALQLSPLLAAVEETAPPAAEVPAPEATPPVEQAAAPPGAPWRPWCLWIRVGLVGVLIRGLIIFLSGIIVL